MTIVSQESRTERAGVAVTPSEKKALQRLRDRLNTTESDLLRDYSIAQIVELDRFPALKKVGGVSP